MKVNAAEESFELMNMLGQYVLFTNMRVVILFHKTCMYMTSGTMMTVQARYVK